MKHLNNFQIFEIRGYLVELEKEADKIIKKLKSSDDFIITINTHRGNFDVNIISLEKEEYLNKYGNTNAICITVPNKNKQLPKIITKKGDLEKSTLIHELKHAFSYMFYGERQLKNNYIINDLSHGVRETYKQYFRLPLETISSVLYFLNRDELEAWYHTYAYEVSHLKIKSDDNTYRKASNQEKKEWLDKKLKSDSVFFILRTHKNGNFRFQNLFKSDKAMHLFLNKFEMGMHKRTNSVFWKIFDLVDIYLSKFKKNKDDYTPAVNSINKEINKNCKIYWKKYMRLYTM